MATLNALAALLKVDAEAYLESTRLKTRAPARALIREAECIGCTKCLQACPVDAIIGSAKTMHAVLDHECTGCGLCLPPCPVDCIDLLPLAEPDYDRDQARQRFEARQQRLNQPPTPQLIPSTKDQRQAYLVQALQRAAAKKKP